MEINRDTARQFVEDFKKSVRGLEDMYGVIINLEAISYNDKSMNGKLSVINGNAEEAEYNAFVSNLRKFAFLYGLTKDDYGRLFQTRAGVAKLIALKPSNRKYPFIVNINGTKYKMSASQLGLVSENGLYRLA